MVDAVAVAVVVVAAGVDDAGYVVVAVVVDAVAGPFDIVEKLAVSIV